jgi:sulfur relay (sulfurtransferase) DsrC/TusE family protein
MSIQRNFEYLGQSFQLQLLNQIIVDKDFTHSIIDVIEPSHFENKYFKTILQMVKEYYAKYSCSPSFETLEQISKSEFPQEMMLRILMDTIKQIQNAPFEGASFVQDKALKFTNHLDLNASILQRKKPYAKTPMKSFT